MKVCHRILLVSMIVSAVIFPVYAQQELSDTARMGLDGPVGSVLIQKADFIEIYGDWVLKDKEYINEIEFNSSGYKTLERLHRNSNNYKTYVYDKTDKLVLQEEYNNRRLVFSWERIPDAENSYSIVQIRYNSEGTVTSRIVQSYGADEEKFLEIHYDEDNRVIQKWERRQTSSGIRINHNPRYGGNEFTLYNNQNQIIEMRRGSGNSLQRWVYVYNGTARITEARYTDKTDFSPDIYTFQYNSEGRLTESAHSQKDGIPVNRRFYVYEGGSTVETVEWFNQQSGILNHTWIYTYDTAGNIIEKEYRRDQRPFSIRWTYSYDSRNRVIKGIFYDSEGRIFSMKETAWDRRGNKISESSSGRGIPMAFRIIYEYDTANRQIETVNYNSEGELQSRTSSMYNGKGDLVETAKYDSENKLQSRTSSVYNDNGDLVETASYNPDGSLINKTNYIFVYDEIGNWTEKKKLVTNNAKETYEVPDEIIFRTITYD